MKNTSSIFRAPSRPYIFKWLMDVRGQPGDTTILLTGSCQQSQSPVPHVQIELLAIQNGPRQMLSSSTVSLRPRRPAPRGDVFRQGRLAPPDNQHAAEHIAHQGVLSQCVLKCTGKAEPQGPHRNSIRAHVLTPVVCSTETKPALAIGNQQADVFFGDDQDRSRRRQPDNPLLIKFSLQPNAEAGTRNQAPSIQGEGACSPL